jgi:hypothetical protein
LGHLNASSLKAPVRRLWTRSSSEFTSPSEAGWSDNNHRELAIDIFSLATVLLMDFLRGDEPFPYVSPLVWSSAPPTWILLKNVGMSSLMLETHWPNASPQSWTTNESPLSTTTSDIHPRETPVMSGDQTPIEEIQAKAWTVSDLTDETRTASQKLTAAVVARSKSSTPHQTRVRYGASHFESEWLIGCGKAPDLVENVSLITQC